MREYKIYDMQSDELIGTVEANNAVSAEIKASEKFNIESDRIYALS